MLKSYDEYEVTAGDLLRGGRATLGLDIFDVAARIKLPVKTLEEIENGIYRGDRPDYLVNNIIRDYAEFLGLDSVNIKDLFWRQVEKALLEKEESKPAMQYQPTGLLVTIKRLLSRLAGR
jgi:cytoskeletal protein RodZ